MRSDELKALGEAEQREILEAYKMGVRACVFLAREIERLFSMDKVMGEGQCGAEILMPILEFSIDPAMQTMGDFLNNCDAVDDEAEQATDGAFARVRSVLQKYGHKPKHIGESGFEN